MEYNGDMQMEEKTNLFQNLFVFEMANNHMGSVERGLKTIRDIRKVCDHFDFQFAFKLQYRNLDTFIHPDFQKRQDIKFVKRFSDTRLSNEQLKILKDEIKNQGFISVCTPFDEDSVDLVEKHDFDIIKIASCSLTDWSLLERIALTNKPIIASTAGASLEDIDKVAMFMEHRSKQFCLMHCVAEYPTKEEHLQLNQIDLLKIRYPNIKIGYSTHESPDNLDAIKIAIAKGAKVFEKHVGSGDDLNAYSATPEQAQEWLKSAKKAFEMGGIIEGRTQPAEGEKESLMALSRAVYAKESIKKGEKIGLSNIFFAIPSVEEQIFAKDMSKYAELQATTNIDANKPILKRNVVLKDVRTKVAGIIKQVKNLLLAHNVALPNKLEFELSHHYGIEKFDKYGATIINCINREYCKKIVVLVPGQSHPLHFHKLKEETFHVLYGDIYITINGIEKEYKPGDFVIIERGARHSFKTKYGAIFEEISTTHRKSDSYYEDIRIEENKKRKTELTYWSDWLETEIK